MRPSDLRFCVSNLLLVGNLAFFLAGGVFALLSFPILLAMNTVVDQLFGEDRSPPLSGESRFLDAMLVLTLPLLALNSLIFAHYFTVGDPLGLVAALDWIGLDFNESRRSVGALGLLSATLAIGGYSGSAMNVAHELVHRTTNPGLTLIGRWLSAFSWESSFSLQHMVGHHINAGSYDDPGTSRRGESVYAFVVRASIGNNRAAFRNEVARLERRGEPFFSRHNQFLAGQAMTLAIALAYIAISGWTGLAAFFIVGLQGRFYLEASAYIEHYGLVRVPGTRFEARHSWNTYRRLSNGLLYNVPRHADHHLHASRPFYQLAVDEGAPTLPASYITMVALTMIPPLWNAIMRPRLARWDRDRATPGELRYLAENGAGEYLPIAAE